MFIFLASSVQSLSHVRLFVTPWTAALQASLSITNSQSTPKLMSIESVMPSSHLILCRPLLLPPSIFPSIGVFSNESEMKHFHVYFCSFLYVEVIPYICLFCLVSLLSDCVLPSWNRYNCWNRDVGPPGGNFATPSTVDKLRTVGCHTWEVLLTSSGQRPEMQLNILLRAGPPQSTVPESCPTLETPWTVPYLGISVHGISQARIQEWVAISSSRRSSWPGDQTCVSYVSCIGRRILFRWNTSFVAPNVCISRLSNCARWSNQTSFKIGSFVIFSTDIYLGRALWGRRWRVISWCSCLLSPGT